MGIEVQVAWAARRRAAMVVIACALCAGLAAAVPPTGGYDYAANDRSVYDVSTVFLLSLLLVAGVGVMFADRVVRRIMAVIGFAAATQLVGTGLVAWRRWHTSAGFGTKALNEELLRFLSLCLAAAGSIGAVACLTALWGDRALRRIRPVDALLVVGAIVAAVVAVAVPIAMGHEAGARLTQVGAHALMYGLPWGLALLLGALVDRTSAIAAALVVLISAMALLGDIVMIPAPRADAGFAVAAVAVAVLVVAALLDRGRRPSRQ